VEIRKPLKGRSTWAINMTTGNFQVDLKPSSGNFIVEVLNINQVLTQELTQYQGYIPVIGEILLECCDVSTAISSLANAPIPDIDTVEDNKAKQATKVHEIWSNYPKAGLQLYLDNGNGVWRKQGQPIVLQNRPFQLPVNVLKPYLSSINNYKMLNRKSRLGAQIISGSGWSQLSGNDEVSVKGDWRFILDLKEVRQESIRNWYPITKELLQDTSQIIIGSNENRRSIVLTNDGESKIYIYFGSTSIVSTQTGIPLNPGDTTNFLTDRFYVPNEISAIAIGGNSRLVGMEGTI